MESGSLKCPFCQTDMLFNKSPQYWLGEVGVYWYFYTCPTCGFIAKFLVDRHEGYLDRKNSLSKNFNPSKRLKDEVSITQ